MFRVPSQYLIPRIKLRIAEDLLDATQVFLVNAQEQRIALLPAVRITEVKAKTSPDSGENYPVGSLSALLETYRGRILPRPVSGFGLPEIYQCLATAVGRAVPDTEREAELVLQWLKKHGPFQPKAFNDAIDTVIKRLGKGRTLAQMLDELTRIINSTKRNKENNNDH
jgi:hypothetical protein